MPSTDPEIFEQARKITSADDRLAFLKEVCEDESQLQRLLKLLDVNVDDSFLENPTADLEGLHGTIDRTGEIIDSYRLKEKIGHGGMGVVYRAEQFEPITRTVAIKLIRIDTSIDKVIPRFETERQALALMEHPNIARFYDAGTTSRGNPYFVMEYVEGVILTKYCDSNRLDISERIELFRKICNAVIHAHQKGIVHRDLKPGNIIVTQIDGVAVPKVIDFGLAKSQQAQWDHETVQSDFGQFLGTLAYMSPEQTATSSTDIDARSDIYSLGIILYELLVGSPPFPPRQFKEAALDEAIRIIRDSDPPTPISSLENSKTNSEIAARRSLDATQLRRLVRGDLELIVMKMLEKEPLRRYQTAQELVADIDRFSKQETVHARPPSLIYKTKKYVRRNQNLVTTSAIALVAILFGFWLTGLFGYKQQSESERFDIAVVEIEKLFDQGDYEQSLVKLDQLDKTHPNNLRLYLIKSDVYERLESYNDQIRTLGEVIEFAPESFDARVERAKAYQLITPPDYLNAEKDLREALSLRENNAEATRLLKELQFRFPVATEDGQCIIYSHAVMGGNRNFCVLPDGSQAREIHKSPKLEGPKIIIDPDIGGQFHVLLEDNSESAKMISSHDGITISPDRKRIVYQDRTDEIYDLVLMDFDGSNRKVLVSDRYVYTPVISPDGNKVAFMIHEEGDFEIAVINMDGTGFKVLTKTKGRDGGLSQGAWSKDSNRLVFMSERKQRPRWMYIVNITTLEETELGVGYWPHWAAIDERGNFKPQNYLLINDKGLYE